MLRKIRANTQGWFAWALIIGIAVVFTLWGMSGVLMDTGSSKVAKVNGEVIDTMEYQMAYERLLRQQQYMQAIYGNQNGIDENLIRQQALQALISQAMLNQSAEKAGFAVSREQVDKVLLELPQFQDEGRFSKDLFESTVSSMLYTPASFRESVGEDLMRGQVQQSLQTSAFVLPKELDYLVKLIEERRDFYYVTFSQADFEPEVVVTEEEIEQYYQAHQSQFVSPDLVSLEYIELDADDYIIEDLPTEDELEAFYKEHIAEFTTAEKRQASHILVDLAADASEEQLAEQLAKAEDLITQLNEGASFAELAQEHSADFGSRESGGDLGWFGRGEMVAAFEEAVFDAEELGVIGPVQTEYGFHIIDVIDIEPEVTQPFEDVKYDLVAKWQDERQAFLFHEQALELDKIAYENPESLELAAKVLDKEIEVTAAFSYEGGHHDIERNRQVVEAAFSDDLLYERINSDIVFLEATRAIVFRVKGHAASELKPLEEVYNDINYTLVQEGGLKLAKQAARDLEASLAEVNREEVPALLDKSHASEVKFIDNFSRQSYDVSAEVSELVFAMPNVLNDGQVVVESMPVGTEDYALVILDDVREGTPEQASETIGEPVAKEDYLEGIKRYQGDITYKLYTVDMQQNSKVSVHLD